MKYEAVFGDKYLADKFTNERSVFIVDRSGVYFEFEDGGAGVNYIANFCAIGDRYYMRRIIRTPTWTAADQKAGKLPEVGAKFKARGYAWECVRILNNTILAVVGDSYCGFELNECTPIETPEEKAARLRVEWCKKAIGCAPISSEMQHYEMKRLGEYIGNIYDALLSGDLPVPVKG